MPRLFLVLALASLAFQPLLSGDAPLPNGGNGGNGAPTPPAADDQQDNRNRMIQRLIADNPELKGVNLDSPEGKEKVRQAMQKRMEAGAPQMRQHMAEQQAAAHIKLRESFAMKEDDFKAIEPLLTKIENLRMQKNLVDPAGLGMNGFMGGRGGRGGRGMFNPQMLLGNTPLDPSVQETQDATKALKTLIDDPQANAAEVAGAVTRVRKAREIFQATLLKVQEELRSVLTPRQEAILVDLGTLE